MHPALRAQLSSELSEFTTGSELHMYAVPVQTSNHLNRTHASDHRLGKYFPHWQEQLKWPCPWRRRAPQR